MQRFPTVAHTLDDARRYYRERAIQLLPWDWTWDGRFREHPWGIEVTLVSPQGVAHRSAFVVEGHAGRGHYRRWVAAAPEVPLVTSGVCEAVRSWLDAHGVPYTDIPVPDWPEYRAIASYYGDTRAARSGLYYMAHIDEGLFVLKQLEAAPVVASAWCLHPLVQADEDLARTLATGALAGCDPHAVALAMEYRSVANAHLSRHPPKVPAPGPPEVRAMLIADKVQNRKDFERCLRGRVANSARLDAYFAEWFGALGISEAQYAAWVDDLARRCGQPVVVGWDGDRASARSR